MSKELTRTPPEKHDGPDHSAPYPVSRMAPAIELLDLAKEIAQADTQLANRASAKLDVIAAQIRALQQAARQVLEQTRHDQQLHRAQCNFKRSPGKIYHLYEKSDGTPLFSMLAPEEWRGQPPYRFLGSYRLENDMSWTPAGQIESTGENAHELVQRLLGE
ncbi:MAG TPA: DUF2452 domain-containing protein [Gammaproteobacteria bacterium]